jgi:PAS domain S-box-containing protein
MAEKIRVLYVDDEQSLLDLCKMFLERSGNFIVTTSRGAPEALRMLELARFDAIISDYQMPEMDGIEFLKVIRGRGDKTPFIIFTGKGREEVVIEALNRGADHYLQKGGEPKSQFAELGHKIRKAVEHQRDEKSLQKSQVQLAEAMDLAHIANWEFDVASGIFTFNDRFYALYGTTAEREGGYEMPAEVYAREFVHPDERGMVADEVQNAIHATDPDYTRQIEHRIIRRDGEIRYIIVRFGITKDARGRTVKTHGANQDITDRKRAEESLRKSEERYRAIVEDQTEFICRFISDGRLTFVNDAYCRYFDLDKDRCLDRPHFVRLPPEDAQIMKKHLASLTPLNPVAAIEHRIIMPSGEIRWQRWNDRAIFSGNGKVVEYQSVGRDITEHKRVEVALQESHQILEAVLNTITVRVFWKDRNSIYLGCNTPFARDAGFEKPEDIIGKDDYAMGWREQAELYRGDDRTVIESGRPKLLIEEPQTTPSGERISLLTSKVPLKDTNGEIIGVLGTYLDITARKMAEEALKESEEKYRTLFEESFDGYFITSPEGKILDMNKKGVSMFGYDSKEEILSLDLEKDVYAYPPDRKRILSMVNAQGSAEYEVVVKKKSGEKMVTYCSLTAVKDETGHITSYRGIIRDITEKKRAEAALRESEEIFHTVADFTYDWELWLGQDHQITYCSPSCERITGYAPEAFIADPQLLMKIVHPDDLMLMEEHNHTAWKTPEALSVDFRIIHRDGSVRWIGHACQVVTAHDGTLLGRRVSNRDITERRNLENTLRESEEKFRNVFDWANDAILLHTLTVEGAPGRFIEANQVACHMLGYTRDELLAMGPADIIAPELHPQLAELVRQAQTQDSFLIESRVLRKDRTTVPVESSIHLVNYEGKRIWISHIRDITERKRAETELVRVNRALRMLITSTQALVHITDEVLLMNEICRIIVEVGGYRLAWIGFAEQDEAKTVRPVAHAGFDSGYIESANLTWADSERGRGPGGIALRTGQPSLVRNISEDPAFAPWRAEAIVHGYQSIIALPLTSEGRTFGALGIYASETDAFDTEEVEILKDLAGDLAFGIIALRTRVMRAHGEETIRDLNMYNRSLIEASLDPLVTINDNGRISDVNLATEQATGYSRKELIGSDFSDYFTEPEKAKEGHLQVLKDGTVRDYPLEIQHKDGHITSVQYNATVYRDKEGNVKGVFAAARDVTKHKKAVDVLRESEDRYRTLFRNVSDAIFLHGITKEGLPGQFIDVNEIACDRLQYTRDELLGLTPKEIDAPETWAESHKRVNQLLTEGNATFEAVHVTKDGTRVPVEISAHVFTFSNQKMVLSLVRDITERKRTEETLRESEEKYRTLAANLPEIVYRVYLKENGRMQFFNDQVVALTGYTEPELKKGTVCSIEPLILADDRQRVCTAVEKAIAKGGIFTVEYRLIHKDGSIRHFIERGRIIDGDDTTPLYIDGLIHDITERKKLEDALRKSEEQYRSLLENVPELILVHRNGIILYTNPAAVKSLGYQPHEALNRHVTDFIAPEFHERVADAMRRRIRSELVEPYEIDVMSRDGTRRTMIINGTRIEFEGAPASLIVLVDITEQKALYDAVTLANKKLNLLSSVTRHDIINQLLALRGYLELSGDMLDDPVKLAEFVAKEQNIANTIEDQILFTKDYQDLGIKMPEWQNVHESVMKAKESLSLRGIAVEMNCPALEVYADPLLVRVFYNLIDNALRYGGEKMTAIRIWSKESNRRLVIVCEDNGVGVPADKKEAIFTRGYFNHTGFGLFLSREILSITGITIIENGVPGKGARFEIAVPKGGFRFTDSGIHS